MSRSHATTKTHNQRKCTLPNQKPDDFHCDQMIANTRSFSKGNTQFFFSCWENHTHKSIDLTENRMNFLTVIALRLTTDRSTRRIIRYENLNTNQCMKKFGRMYGTQWAYRNVLIYHITHTHRAYNRARNAKFMQRLCERERERENARPIDWIKLLNTSERTTCVFDVALKSVTLLRPGTKMLKRSLLGNGFHFFFFFVVLCALHLFTCLQSPILIFEKEDESFQVTRK